MAKERIWYDLISFKWKFIEPGFVVQNITCLGAVTCVPEKNVNLPAG